MCYSWVTLAALDPPIVISMVDRVHVSIFARAKHSSMDSAVAAPVRVVVVVVNVEDFE